MERYRATGSADDPSVSEGDLAFLGVNSWDNPENLEPGQVQEAVNLDFTRGAAETRGGFVCLPELALKKNALTWTAQDAATANDWSATCYGNNVFVAVSTTGRNDRVMTSADGETWITRVSIEDNAWQDVCWGGNQFVAVASDGVHRVMTSRDGVTWVARTAATAAAWSCVAYGRGMFVALSTDSKVMSSPTAITWIERVAAPASEQWTAVAYGNGLFVAVGALGTVMTSPDGVTWTVRSVTGTPTFGDITYGGGRFMAVATNRVLFSLDGINWTEATTVPERAWCGVAYNNGQFVAVTADLPIMDTFVTDGGDTLVTDGGVELALTTSSGARFMSSTDGGITWVGDETIAQTGWQAIAGGGGLFVTVNNTGTSRVAIAGSLERIFACGVYGDVNDAGARWIMLLRVNSLTFYASGRTSRVIPLTPGLKVSQPSTIVQCANRVYIFRGDTAIPLYWNGDWNEMVTITPAAVPISGFSSIPKSNHAVYYQNRLWVKNGKDNVAASDVLDFTQYDDLANSFNLNTGDSDYIVCLYPFGTASLLVFKNRSILVLTGVDGSLLDVSMTEITRQVGAVGSNAVVTVGADVVYMSDRNVNLISLTSTNNALQHTTLPLSRNIRSILSRVNWACASKVSMAYWNNKVYLSLPVDNSTTCNAVVVYNFVTEQWYGEWNFAAELGLGIQGWVISDYCGFTRLFCVAEDGRIFVTDEGPNDISSPTVCEIATSMTTRAYRLDGAIGRRMNVDLSTNRPKFSVTAYVDGANEYTTELTDQTFARSQSWLWGDAPYDMTNANDDYNRAFRKDYSTGPDNVRPGTSGFLPEMAQDFRLPIITRRKGLFGWIKLTNTQGYIKCRGVGLEARPGHRSSLIEVG